MKEEGKDLKQKYWTFRISLLVNFVFKRINASDANDVKGAMKKTLATIAPVAAFALNAF